METVEINALINEYGDAVLSFCVYLAKNRADGEDLFQQTFLKAIENAHKIDSNRNPKSYLISIAINLWKNVTQKRARQWRLFRLFDTNSDEVAAVADSSVDIEGGVIAGFESDVLRRAINSLDEKYRVPIILFYSENMKIAEIADILNKPEGTIKRHLHEAKQRIKTEMEALGYE